jgi:Conjugal transfer protein TraD
MVRVMTDDGTHSKEQGLRVHHLANLGGLVALAGLDMEPPDFLLGALLSIAREAAALSPAQRAEIAAPGQLKLDERASGKRAWTSWKRARELHGFTLSTGQIQRVLAALGGTVPKDREALAPALMQVLAEVE